MRDTYELAGLDEYEGFALGDEPDYSAIADEEDGLGDDLALDAIDWDEGVEPESYLSDVLRRTLHGHYSDASDEEMEDALADILGTMSPAESFNFTGALNQIGRSAGQLLSDPTVGSVLRTALPIAGGAVGTVLGGPVGTALGSQLGTVAVGALPTRATMRSAPLPTVGAPLGAVPVTIPGTVTASGTPVIGPATQSPVAGGSTAATQAFLLTQQPQMLQSLLATALGQHGRQQVGGVPVAQLLGMLSRVVGQAAADADELMYLDQHGDEQYGDDGESAIAASSFGPDRSLYASLFDADNIGLAEAFDYEGVAW